VQFVQIRREKRPLQGENPSSAKESVDRVFVRMKKIALTALLCGTLLALTPGCNRNALTGSKLTINNYNQVTAGMSKAQVERIMGPPTTSEIKDMLIFKKTTYRYEDGPKFALFTFKNDELDTKEGNLATP
jgi:SmpA / OmlA family